METHFTPEQLHEAPIKIANDILRTCVHCGFCTATCPTYVVLGDELDSPRGRIYQIREMLQSDKPADANTVKHVDRCLSCLSCMTTCPSGVDYMHLVDHARVHIENTYKRPLADSALRLMLSVVLPRPGLFRLSLIGARLAKPFRALLPGRLKGMIAMAPGKLPKADPVLPLSAHGKVRKRVALLPGCAQQVLAPRINRAAARLLSRLGCEVFEAANVGCCGALTHHMGKEDAALAQARANIAAWEKAKPDLIAITASGCGSTVKDYGFMLKDDPVWADRAAKISAIARDVSEVIAELGLNGVEDFDKPRVAYHAPCSLQHGQKNLDGPADLLKAAGFTVSTPKNAHLCCGSAGTYNIMQPEMAAELGGRKASSLDVLNADVIATGNIGCLIQIGEYAGTPVVHSVELLDWATGGPSPLQS
ncbi:glycolate oxidase subunit GlcF [Magnetovibrio sp.]|uniref:glycolate oxidase subunit GlcF n=1 Tax=Magnetovibrio sp. TaxID=2024836 RepID=UPI002F947A0B